jgi:RND superfamily putative drug exporter
VDSNTSVRLGLQRSGRIITSAALLMLIVFACFAAAKVGQLEQIGLGLFVAVLIDATLVRCLLVPAVMSLLGRAAWWAPGPLQRLHSRVGLQESEAPVSPAAAPVAEGTKAV